MSDEQNGDGVKVKDKRRFKVDDDGVVQNQNPDEVKQENDEKASEDPKPEKTSDDDKKQEQEAPADSEPQQDQKADPPPVSFQSLVFSLATAAMMHMGDIADPEGKSAKDINMAKQTIDLLGILSEKTQGNLTKEEEAFLSSVLRDLRLRFVQAKK